jgi:hypothetical protein
MIIMSSIKVKQCEKMLEEANDSISKLELKEFNLELEGSFNPDRDQQLEFTRAELKAEKQRRKSILEVINKLKYEIITE